MAVNVLFPLLCTSSKLSPFIANFPGEYNSFACSKVYPLNVQFIACIVAKYASSIVSTPNCSGDLYGYPFFTILHIMSLFNISFILTLYVSFSPDTYPTPGNPGDKQYATCLCPSISV